MADGRVIPDVDRYRGGCAVRAPQDIDQQNGAAPAARAPDMKASLVIWPAVGQSCNFQPNVRAPDRHLASSNDSQHCSPARSRQQR